MGTIVGNLIKKYRKEKVIPQKVLCDGICTVSTLSRIENGIYMPSLMQIEVFFSRLGKAVPYNLVPVTFRERKIYNIKTAISMIYDNRDPKRKMLLDELKECLSENDFLTKQYYLLVWGIYISQFDERLEEARSIFINALNITEKKYEEISTEKIDLYSTTELSLIINIAHVEYYIYEIQKEKIDYKESAIKTMEFLKTYYEKNVEDYLQKTIYSSVIFMLTNWYGLDKNYEKSLELSSKGIKITNESAYLFSRHIFNKGYSLASMGNIKEAELKFSLSLNIIQMMENFGDKEFLIGVIKKRFNIDISSKLLSLK